MRAAKDVGEGGLLTSVFEMCLGRDLGIQLEKNLNDASLWLGEGLGSLVFAVDPHHAKHIEQHCPEARRLGVVMRPPILRFAAGEEWPLDKLKSSYLSLTKKDFWS